MTTLAPWIPCGEVQLAAQAIDGFGQQAPLPRALWQESGWGGLDEPGPQTESSIDRGFRLRGSVDDEWGRSESLDPDDVGDIADEGMGHRG